MSTAPAPRRMLRQGIHTIAVRSVTLVCRMALLVVIGKTLAPEEYGVYALLGTLGIFGTVALGLNLYIYVYRAVPGRDAADQLRIFKSTSTFEIALSSIVVAALLASGALPGIASLMNAKGYELFLALGLIQIILLVAIAESSHFFAAQARIEEANWLDFLAQGLWVLVPAALWIGGAAVGLGTLVGAQIAGLLLGVAYAATRVGARAWLRQAFDWDVIRAGLRFSLPLIVPGLSFYVLKVADRPILSHYVSLADVGIYAFAFALLNTLYSFTAGVVFSTLSPRIVAAHNAGDHVTRDVLQTYMLKIALVAFALPAVALFLTAGPLLTVVAREEYLASAAVMPLVAVSFVMMILACPAHTLLTVQDRVKTAAVVDTIGMVAGLTATLLLIPRFSYWGAAVASAFGFAVGVLLKYAASGTLRTLRLDVLFSVRHDAALLTRYAGRFIPGRRAAAAPEYMAPVDRFES